MWRPAGSFILHIMIPYTRNCILSTAARILFARSHHRLRGQHLFRGRTFAEKDGGQRLWRLGVHSDMLETGFWMAGLKTHVLVLRDQLEYS